ncbi:MAG: hypothetical protein GY798_33145 [Hyphomicrobiales bacterium]|nr:hypothetical protein [Hyphomicrobiales bacterium]
MTAGRIALIGINRPPYEQPKRRSLSPTHRSPAIPRPPPLTGEVPSPINPLSGCAFRTRCPYAVERCAAERPELRPHDGRSVACHRVEEIPYQAL